jgi:hypothetical protein
MNAESSICFDCSCFIQHADFLDLIPTIEKHARIAFRYRNATEREEATAEAVAVAFKAFVALKASGKDPARDFPSQMASFAVLQVKGGRQVGTKCSSTDVLSRKAQLKRGFHVGSICPRQNYRDDVRLDDNGRCWLGDLNCCLQDNFQTPIPEQVAFRIDFFDFICGLNARDRELACFLGQGHSAREAAAKFKVSRGRISQLRKRWRRDWLLQQGELTPAAVMPSTE